MKQEELKHCLETFGLLTVLETFRRNGRTYAQCVCDCGTRIEVRLDSLKSGKTKSCGCLKRKTGIIVRFLNSRMEGVLKCAEKESISER